MDGAAAQADQGRQFPGAVPWVSRIVDGTRLCNMRSSAFVYDLAFSRVRITQCATAKFGHDLMQGQAEVSFLTLTISGMDVQGRCR